MKVPYQTQLLLAKIASFYSKPTLALHLLLKAVQEENPQIAGKDGGLRSSFFKIQEHLHRTRIKNSTPPPHPQVLEIFLASTEFTRTIQALSPNKKKVRFKELELSDITDHPEHLCFIPPSKTERMNNEIFSSYEGHRPEAEFDGLEIPTCAIGDRLLCENLASNKSKERSKTTKMAA